MIKVMTKHICPPIPVRCADWAAWIDGMEETPHLNGIGETEVLALLDLGCSVDTEEQIAAVHEALSEARQRQAAAIETAVSRTEYMEDR